MFVAATEFCCRNKSHRFSLIGFFATCCSDKIPLRRQRFSQRFSSTHGAICRCDVSPHRVAATCCPICSHGVICRCDVLLQLVAQCVPTLKRCGSAPDLSVCYFLQQIRAIFFFQETKTNLVGLMISIRKLKQRFALLLIFFSNRAGSSCFIKSKFLACFKFYIIQGHPTRMQFKTT